MSVYWDASKFINVSDKNQLKREVFRASEQKKIKTNPKQIFALILSVWKYKKYLLEIIKNSKILTFEKNLKEDVVVIMVHDLLLTKQQRIHMGKNKLKDQILNHKTRLMSEFTKLKLKYGVQSLSELINDEEEDEDPSTPVRWIRINTIKTKFEDVIEDLENKGFNKVDSVDDIQQKEYYIDEYIPNLIGVSPKTKITSFKSYLNGEIIIQDRASCFPAFILNPKAGKDVIIDACAAPGNKTTHLAMLLKNFKSSVFAFERDQNRGQTLKKMLKTAGALNCVKPTIADFTSTDPKEFDQVTGLLVDPSCSGSGIFDRSLKQEYDEQRLTKLSSFQFSIMKHALSFRNANKVIYSTCSIHAQEDEKVVVDLLLNQDIQDAGWRLAKRSEIIPKWERRGLVEEFKSFENPEELAGGCIRVLPKVDGGIGFFAALFIRNGYGEEEETEEEEEYNEETKEASEESDDDLQEEEWTGFDD